MMPKEKKNTKTHPKKRIENESKGKVVDPVYENDYWNCETKTKC